LTDYIKRKDRRNARRLVTTEEISGMAGNDLFRMRIGGERVAAASGRSFAVLNPKSGAVLAEVPEGDRSDIDAAVAAAREAFPEWAATSPARRAEVMNRIAALMRERLPSLVELEVDQTGRPIREMSAQLARLPEWYEYFGAVARTHEDTVPPFGGPYLNYTRRVPIGVVGLITPWNHPLLILTKKVAPAMAAGNAMVVKPSELAPLTPLLLADICQEAGLPDGVFNVVTGFGAGAGAALASHTGISKIDVTGGTETGKRVAALAGANLVRFAGELGGKAPLVAFDDSAIDSVVSAAMFGAFVASGQTCVQAARLLVHRRIHDEVLQRLRARVEAIRIGDPRIPDTQMGPVISERQRALVESYVAIGRDEGASLVTGGKRPEVAGLPGGFWMQPTVFGAVRPDMRIAQEEIFGPVIAVLPFGDEDEAVALANDSAFGLAASVWTRDVSRAHRVASRIEAGVVWINDHHRIDPASPWGGFKASGLGRENGLGAYEAYTEVQSVIVNLSDRPFDWYAGDAAPKRYS